MGSNRRLLSTDFHSEGFHYHRTVLYKFSTCFHRFACTSVKLSLALRMVQDA